MRVHQNPASVIQDHVDQTGKGLPLSVVRGDVAVVRADLRGHVERIDGDAMKLSVEEQRRAKGYVREEDRRLFIQRRILLRRLLGDIVGCEPGEVAIRTDGSGKPFLDPDGLPWPLSFSLSHSRDRVLYAFARDREVGVDIEYCDSAVEVMKMAGVICTPGERTQLGTLTDPEQRSAFYDCWCSKEAFIKAAGVREPTSFDVSFWPNDPKLACLDGKPISADSWSFHRLETGSDWSAVLVVEGNENRICEFGD